jgi:hypothetical protein
MAQYNDPRRGPPVAGYRPSPYVYHAGPSRGAEPLRDAMRPISWPPPPHTDEREYHSPPQRVLRVGGVRDAAADGGGGGGPLSPGGGHDGDEWEVLGEPSPRSRAAGPFVASPYARMGPPQRDFGRYGAPDLHHPPYDVAYGRGLPPDYYGRVPQPPLRHEYAQRFTSALPSQPSEGFRGAASAYAHAHALPPPQQQQPQKSLSLLSKSARLREKARAEKGAVGSRSGGTGSKDGKGKSAVSGAGEGKSTRERGTRTTEHRSSKPTGPTLPVLSPLLAEDTTARIELSRKRRLLLERELLGHDTHLPENPPLGDILRGPMYVVKRGRRAKTERLVVAPVASRLSHTQGAESLSAGAALGGAANGSSGLPAGGEGGRDGAPAEEEDQMYKGSSLFLKGTTSGNVHRDLQEHFVATGQVCNTHTHTHTDTHTPPLLD